MTLEQEIEELEKEYGYKIHTFTITDMRDILSENKLSLQFCLRYVNVTNINPFLRNKNISNKIKFIVIINNLKNIEGGNYMNNSTQSIIGSFELIYGSRYLSIISKPFLNINITERDNLIYYGPRN